MGRGFGGKGKRWVKAHEQNTGSEKASRRLEHDEDSVALELAIAESSTASDQQVQNQSADQSIRSNGAYDQVFGQVVQGPRQREADEHWPETPWQIAGNGPRAGLPPRGAGIVAFRLASDASTGPLVCVVEKADGKKGFPKGGRNTTKGESVLHAARREWREETGISVARLQLCQGVSVDDDCIGCRYLVAACQNARLGGGQPDDGTLAWAPPCEDPEDRDPIVKAQWLPIDSFITGRFQLSKARRRVLDCAIAHLLARVGVEPTGRKGRDQSSHDRRLRCSLLNQAIAQLNDTDVVPVAAPKASACLTNTPAPTPSALTSNEKEAMKLLKKIRDIAKLEESAANGQVLDPKQQEKISSRGQLLRELAAISCLLPSDSDVKAKAQEKLDKDFL